MHYIFKSMMAHRPLKKGDTITLGRTRRHLDDNEGTAKHWLPSSGKRCQAGSEAYLWPERSCRELHPTALSSGMHRSPVLDSRWHLLPDTEAEGHGDSTVGGHPGRARAAITALSPLPGDQIAGYDLFWMEGEPFIWRCRHTD
jgi:hypothetical protein